MKFECLEDREGAILVKEWWDLRCCMHPFERLEDRGGAVSEGNGGTFVILSVEEVRAKVMKFSLKIPCPLKKSGQQSSESSQELCPLKKSGQQQLSKIQSFIVEDAR